MIRKLNFYLTKYRHISRKINEVLTIKTTIKTTLSAILISTFIVLLPSLLIYNLFVFYKLRTILMIAIVLIVNFFSFIFNFAYDKIAKNYHEELNNLNTKVVLVTDSVIAGIILTIVTIIILVQFF